MKIKILLVDDHHLVRSGLRLLLHCEPDFEIAGEAENGPDALDQVRRNPPDIVLMDVDLAGGDGIDASRRILSEFPGTRILILSALPHAGIVEKAIRAGVKGYLLKSNAPGALCRTIRAVMDGQFCLCPEVSHAMMSNHPLPVPARQATPKPHLTRREIEVLKLTADGLRVKDIADRLKIGVKTVETHRASLMKKIGCGSTAELTRHAIREGICPV